MQPRAEAQLLRIPSASNGKELRAASSQYSATIFNLQHDFSCDQDARQVAPLGRRPPTRRSPPTASPGWTSRTRWPAKPTNANTVAVFNKARPELKKLNGKINKRFDAEHIFGCGSGH